MNSIRIANKRRFRTAIVIVAILVTVLSSTAVMAQTSNSFDLGCWSVITGGGGTRISNQIRLTDSVGQTAAGTSITNNTTVRSGYIQSWDTILRPPGDGTPPPQGANVLYLPLISLSVVRRCG